MDAGGVRMAWEVTERRLKATHGDQARIVRHVPMYPTSAPVTQMDLTAPLEIWVFDAEGSDGRAITLIASRSPDGWSLVEKV